jgi:hypothetical protein
MAESKALHFASTVTRVSIGFREKEQNKVFPKTFPNTRPAENARAVLEEQIGTSKNTTAPHMVFDRNGLLGLDCLCWCILAPLFL